MAGRSRKEKEQPPRRPAITVQGRENQVASLAVDLAEKQIREGTASAQVVTHFLKLASTREQLEQERLVNENELLRARVEQLASNSRIEELYEKAINSMRIYAGQEPMNNDED